MYDIIIIGAGWAGFNAAIRAKELGLKACLIEKSKIGGTCLNLGCIPTKALIQSAKTFSLVKKSSNFGLEEVSPKINWQKAQERKNKIISQLSLGMQFRLKGIDFINGEARIVSSEAVQAGDQTLNSKNILLATGSRPVELPAFKFNSKSIISSDDILNLDKIPETLLIIGGGVIGCEFASMFSSLGTRVTIVEKLPQLLPGEDEETARKLETIFKKKGIKVNTNKDATGFDLKAFSLVLVCVGRAGETGGLDLEKIGVKLERGKVIVDEYLRTNIANIYAAGDCTAKFMLAHFAAYQGRIAVSNIFDPTHSKKADNSNIPNCIFSDPEIASVGLNEKSARGLAKDIKVNKFDFLGSGMARILDEAEGFIKIISDSKTGQLLGASIIGPRATELIGILTLAVSCQLSLSQVRNTIFAHPTLSESIHETLS